MTREIARYSWAYQERDSDSMPCFIGTGSTLAEAVGQACGRAHVEGWDAISRGLGLPDLANAMHVQVEDQQESWLVTLFVSDEPVAVAP